MDVEDEEDMDDDVEDDEVEVEEEDDEEVDVLKEEDDGFCCLFDLMVTCFSLFIKMMILVI